MKITSVRLIVMTAMLISATLSARADATSYAQIIKERDRVLSLILADREGRRSAGLADEDAVAAAQLALYSFRRDVATTATEKIKNQELMVRINEKKLNYVKALAKTGMGSDIKVWETTDSLLEAKQILEELRMNKKRTD